MIDTIWKDKVTGENRHVMVEAVGSGLLYGKFFVFTCNDDGEDPKAHEVVDFRRSHEQRAEVANG